MKHNMTAAQYEQLAKEMFCKTMKENPFVSDLEVLPVRAKDELVDFDVIVHFTDHEKPLHFWIEVKSNGEKRFANLFMERVKQRQDDRCYVFMAPYISEESARSMKNGKYNYMDLSGNCYIATSRIFLNVSGQPNQYVIKREGKNYFSKTSGAASAIMRTMLHVPEKEWQVVTLAQESGRAIGTVSNVKKFLKDKDWLEEQEAISAFKLKNIRELLYSWAKNYHMKDARSYEYYSFEAIPELERQITRWSMTHDQSAILAGFSAAARYAPTVSYKKIDVYVEPQFLDEFIKDLELQAVSSGGNITIIVPHDETPCMYANIIHDSYVTSPVQTVIDLLGKAGRGEEAADAIITKEYRGSER